MGCGEGGVLGLDGIDVGNSIASFDILTLLRSKSRERHG